MSEQAQPTPNVTLTYDQLQEILKLVSQPKLNALEQKKLNSELRKEHRERISGLMQGYADDLKRWNQQRGCSHCRWPMFAGANAGQMAPKGQGEWMTSGQAHGDGTVTIICARCNTRWHFKATANELDYAQNSEHGLLGFVPPDISRCLNKDEFLREAPQAPSLKQCDTCREHFTEGEFKSHECLLA